MIRNFIFAASALALASCASTTGADGADSAMADPSGATAAALPAAPTTAMPYTMKAAASDQFEIQSSQVALQKGQNADVRRFAQMLIDHHTQTTATLTAAAQSAGLTPPPPALEPMQQDMIAQLQSAPAGASFDKLYITQQVPAHQMALNVHQAYASGGDKAPLRTAAAAAVPIVQQHLTEATRMNGSM